MVKLGFAVLCVLGGIMAHPQRSPYAPKPVNYPAILPRFDVADNSGSNIENRISEGDSSTPAVVADNLQDPYLVSQVEGWPEDRKPFWFLNAQHIANHRGQPSFSQSVTQTPPRSPFAGNVSQ